MAGVREKSARTADSNESGEGSGEMHVDELVGREEIGFSRSRRSVKSSETIFRALIPTERVKVDCELRG